MKILGEIARESGATTRCFIIDLNALDCRKGCNVCGLEKVARKLQSGFSLTEGPGNIVKLRENKLTLWFRQQSNHS